MFNIPVSIGLRFGISGSDNHTPTGSGQMSNKQYQMGIKIYFSSKIRLKSSRSQTCLFPLQTTPCCSKARALRKDSHSCLGPGLGLAPHTEQGEGLFLGKKWLEGISQETEATPQYSLQGESSSCAPRGAWGKGETGLSFAFSNPPPTDSARSPGLQADSWQNKKSSRSGQSCLPLHVAASPEYCSFVYSWNDSSISTFCP